MTFKEEQEIISILLKNTKPTFDQGGKPILEFDPIAYDEIIKIRKGDIKDFVKPEMIDKMQPPPTYKIDLTAAYATKKEETK